MHTVYQWQINLTNAINSVFDEKRLETCEAEMNKLEEEFKRLIRLNNKNIFKYLAYKFFRESSNSNVYTVQICLEHLEGNTFELLTTSPSSFAIHDATLKVFKIYILCI